RPVELPASDLVLHYLCRSGVELAGKGAKAVGFLLLWYAAAARSVPGKYAVSAGRCCGSAGAGIGTLHAQGYRALTSSPRLKPGDSHSHKWGLLIQRI